MKKLISIIFTVIMLYSCSFSNFSSNNNFAQLDEEDLENIKEQVMIELRQELNNEYFNQLSEIEQKIISTINSYGDSVLGVSNFQNSNGHYIEASTGSGVIYKHILEDSIYYVITNEHVVEGADKVRVVLEDQTYIDAEVVGVDVNTDLAVITFESTRSLPVAEFGDSDNINKGQFAIAIGNPLGYDYYGSVTVGHISGLAREVPIDYQDDSVIDWIATLIQHDAAISPGNSGGGLFDISGKLIGINNMKIVEDTVSDIGFAIPINIVKEVVAELEEKGEVVRPYLGIVGSSVKDVIENNALIDSGYPGVKIELPDGVTSGVYIKSIESNSSATNSDLKAGDIIIKYNEILIDDLDDLRLQIDNSEVGDTITLTINRNGDIIEIILTLKQSPDINK